ncbi:MAG: glutamine synthetase III, partial [Methylococcales bacterium]
MIPIGPICMNIVSISVFTGSDGVHQQAWQASCYKSVRVGLWLRSRHFEYALKISLSGESMSISANQGRLWAIAEISNRTPRIIENGIKASDYFGCNTFNQKVMAEKLPKGVYKSLVKTIHNAHKLDQSIAAAVAHAVKEWAIEKGATHYTHWFQPNTGITAEKHDTFLTIDGDGKPIERFDASQLIQ